MRRPRSKGRCPTARDIRWGRPPAALGGLERACGIPGALGGAAVYSAAAYGKSLADVLRCVRIADPENGIVEMRPEELALEYRNSAFTRGGLRDHVVLTVDLAGQKGDAAEVRAGGR